MNILVTGGAGYIGSHTVVELIQAGHSVVVVDDLSNAQSDVMDRVASIVGQNIKFHVLDCSDRVSATGVSTGKRWISLRKKTE